MSVNNINELVSSIAKLVESNEKVALPVLSVKLHKMAETHPYDQTIVSMASILGKMADNNKLFISREELKGLYNKLYSRNTKFAEYFKDELGELAPLATPTFAPKHEAPVENAHASFSDPILANALTVAFDKTASLKAYADKDASSAKIAVASNLDAWNLKATKLDVEAGNSHFIVINASYNTPKGTTSILVPVETVKGKALEPSVFMCNAGPQELNHTNIKKYITSFAGAKLKVRAEDVLSVLTREVLGGDVVSSVELAATKIASSRENGNAFGGIIGQTVVDAPRNVEVAIPRSKEANSFAAKFASAAGVAEFTFGNDKLSMGRDSIVRQLNGFGIKNPQISVVATDESTIFYGVSIFGGKTSFKVPVKVASNKVSSPEFMICNGSISSFSKESISELLVGGMTDSKVTASTSAQHNLSPSELVENVKSAVREGNHVKAEDALNILQQSGNVSAYRDAFASFVNGLGTTKTASAEQTCSMLVKSANSSHPICGHTNLPAHKVYQDAHGNCQPLYRKGMDETYQGAFFMNSKIFG